MPLLTACEALFAQAQALGHGNDDMVAVIEALNYRDRGE
jgi:3-hydroxyisobutyrate dehydrogenase-like beta-hydroxyacid dehydrogenase